MDNKKAKWIRNAHRASVQKLPKQRLKKKIAESLFQIFLKLVNYVNWYRYTIEWNEKNLKFIFLAIMLETT